MAFRRRARGRRARSREGLSAVEAAAIVCVVGIVLAVFIPSFIHELRTSKTSEAAEHLELLYLRSAAYFAAEHELAPLEPETVEDGEEEAEEDSEAEEPPAPPPRFARRCLPSTAGPTPRTPLVDPAEVPFQDEETPGHATWSALDFQPPIAVRYAYTFEPTASGCELRSPGQTYLLTLRAEGDLDADGERSVFERRFSATEGGELVPFGVLYVRDRME